MFRRGLRPRHPGIKPLAALTEPARTGALRRACLPCRRPALPLWCPAGGLPSLSPAYPAFRLLFCPPSPKGKDIPPTPFPAGRGGGDLRLFYARGFAPCIPGAEPGRHWGRGRTTRPAGGLPALSPSYPAFRLLFCPHPPDPRSQSALPGGKGGLKVILCKGLRPLHPRG